jgi:hypothetical protein
LIAILEKEKDIPEEVREEGGGDGMLVFAISSLDALREHERSENEDKKLQNKGL